MQYLIIGMPAGYAVQLDGKVTEDFTCEAELREYLRGKGVPDRKIDAAIRILSTRHARALTNADI